MIRHLIIIILIFSSCSTTKTSHEKKGTYKITGKNLSFKIQQLIESEGIENIKGLDISNNSLEELPQNLVELVYLESIDLSENNLAQFPNSILELNKLRIINLDGNNILSLPSDFNSLVNLELILYFNNKLNNLQKEEFVCRLPQRTKVFFIKEQSVSKKDFNCDN